MLLLLFLFVVVVPALPFLEKSRKGNITSHTISMLLFIVVVVVVAVFVCLLLLSLLLSVVVDVVVAVFVCCCCCCCCCCCLLLLKLIISKRILLLSPLDRVTPFWLGRRAHLASFHSYFQRKPLGAGLCLFVVVTPAAHLLPQKRSKNNWKYVYSSFQGPPPCGAVALLHPNHSRRNT